MIDMKTPPRILTKRGAIGIGAAVLALAMSLCVYGTARVAEAEIARARRSEARFLARHAAQAGVRLSVERVNEGLRGQTPEADGSLPILCDANGNTVARIVSLTIAPPGPDAPATAVAQVICEAEAGPARPRTDEPRMRCRLQVWLRDSLLGGLQKSGEGKTVKMGLKGMDYFEVSSLSGG